MPAISKTTAIAASHQSGVVRAGLDRKLLASFFRRRFMPGGEVDLLRLETLGLDEPLHEAAAHATQPYDSYFRRIGHYSLT